jgi:predicted nucleic acid-binding protein
VIVAVLDSNVLLSGFVSRSSAPGQILGRWMHGDFRLVVSEPIIEELVRAF